MVGSSYGFYMEYSQHAYIYNSIFWGNEGYEICGGPSYEGVTVDLYYNNIEDFHVCESYFNVIWHEGNISEDPLFKTNGNFDYYLSNNSSCANAGTPDTTGLNLPVVDLAGNPRIVGGRIDIGAMENQEVGIGVFDINKPDIIINLIPNPVSDELNIQYTLEEQGEVIVRISSLQGNQSEIIIDRGEQEGQQHISYNCSHLTPGVYLLHFQHNSRTTIRKFVKL